MAAARPEINGSLSDLLADALPQGTNFTYYHISTPPTKCSAIFSAPPGGRSQRTYCESHFLNVSIASADEQHGEKTAGEVLIFAIEVLIYTTSHLTTIFVSKADSTGYLSLLSLPRSSTSPIRAISTTFVAWLVKHRQRSGTRLLVSLFARAQDQYLFPGSIENENKHVADDTALVKWWCKVLDPVLRQYSPETAKSATDKQQQQTMTAQGHLIIPGFERNETQRFFPPTVRGSATEQPRWKHGHPLLAISRHPNAPPRCLIPHFPDDPKSRYMDELDDELPDGGNATVTSPSRGTGRWRSVRSLDQFWEMMSFRQECSSGRLVGFIWVLFTPADVAVEDNASTTSSEDVDSTAATAGGTQSSTSSLASMLSQPSTTPPKKNKPTGKPSSRSPRRSNKLTGPIVPRLPRIKSNPTSSPTPNSSTPSTAPQPSSTAHYLWPPTSRGTLVLDDRPYTRATELLLHHNFAALDIARVSTRKWVEEVGVLGGCGNGSAWGVRVAGRGVVADVPVGEGEGERVNEVVGRKRRGVEGNGDEAAGKDSQGVTTLAAGLVRKKPKTTEGSANGGSAAEEGGMNVLNGSLIRKKPKV